MRLLNQTRRLEISPRLRTARSPLTRLKGLLGQNSLPESEGLWILPCNHIHTWFMKFPIDVVFVDKNMKVVSLTESVPPFRFIWGGLRAKSVFELPGGHLKSRPIQLGDQLHVEA